MSANWDDVRRELLKNNDVADNFYSERFKIASIKMFFKTNRERYSDNELCVMRLESLGFKKTSKPNRWIKSNEWAEIERHVSGNGFVIQYGGVCK